VDPVTDEKPLTTTGTGDDERVEIELPAELADVPADGEPPDDAPAATAEPEPKAAAPADPEPKAGAAAAAAGDGDPDPLAGLSFYERIEAGRVFFPAGADPAAPVPPAPATSPAPVETPPAAPAAPPPARATQGPGPIVDPDEDFNYDEAASLNDVAKRAIDAAVAKATRLSDEKLGRAMHVMTVKYLEAKEEAFVVKNPDYYDVLKESGVQDAITIDPQTGRPKDPYLHSIIYRQSADPVQAAYDYANAKLHRTKVAEAETRGVEKGRKEIVTQLADTANRPRGIRTLPAAPPPSKGFSRAEIDSWPDERKAWLKQTQPHIYDWYMGATA
jgi:hypothetical protein